jgi:hypothetical protein
VKDAFIVLHHKIGEGPAGVHSEPHGYGPFTRIPTKRESPIPDGTARRPPGAPEAQSTLRVGKIHKKMKNSHGIIRIVKTG